MMGGILVGGDEDAATNCQSRTSLAATTAPDDLLSHGHPARFVGAFVDGLLRDTCSEMEIHLDGDPQ